MLHDKLWLDNLIGYKRQDVIWDALGISREKIAVRVELFQRDFKLVKIVFYLIVKNQNHSKICF